MLLATLALAILLQQPTQLNIPTGLFVTTTIQAPDFDKEVLEPLRAVQAEEARVAAEAEAKEAARVAAEQAEAARVAEEARLAAQRALYVSYGLTGQTGWSYAGGNCVNTAKAYGKNQPGNPISWYPTTNQPFIGAAALFYYNHVAIVVGIWGNGDIEIAQENSPGMPHRISQSQIRGYF